jgi:Zn-dependent metalloprotease
MKKLIAVLLTLCLLGTLIPATALAADKTQKISLEKAIQIAKGHFQPGKEFDQFDSAYEQSEFANVWSLRWYSSKEHAEVNVRIDAETGEVDGYNYYNPKDYEGFAYSSIPKVTKKEGEKIALDFIKKFAPSKAEHVVLKPSNQMYYGGPIFHNYTFYRVVNGIEYPGNNINVEVNGQTGEVRNFYSQWEKLSLAPVKAKLTQKDAQNKFNEDFGLELRYFKPQLSYRGQSKPVKLVYEIINPYQVTIDALTGEIVLDDYYYPYFRESEMAMDMGGAGSPKQELEPFEQEAVDEIKGLISKESALDIAKKVIDIPNKYNLLYSELRSDWEHPELKIWAFNWNYENKNHFGWISVEINAKTGQVLSFSSNEHQYDEQGRDLLQPETKVINTRAEAEKIIKDFIKTNYPEAVDNLQLRKDHQYELLIKYGKEAPNLDKDQAYYYFNYERLVDGIPYEQNYVNATVNSYTGKISDFRIRFIDTAFPTTGKVINQKQFVADFFKENPMQLVYTKDRDKNLRLVYKLSPLTSYRFDAITGDMLNWAGEVIKDTRTEELSGITGHPAEKDIKLLNELSLLYVKDGAYAPDAQLTQAELIKMLVKSTNSYINDSTQGDWYDAYYEQAKNSGLISEKEIAPAKIVTREEMAKFLVRTLVWDKIATLDIYQVPDFTDADQISKGYEGYVTIINGMELMKLEDNSFKPKAQVKKGDACTLMVEYLRMEKQRIY